MPRRTTALSRFGSATVVDIDAAAPVSSPFSSADSSLPNTVSDSPVVDSPKLSDDAWLASPSAPSTKTLVGLVAPLQQARHGVRVQRVEDAAVLSSPPAAQFSPLQAAALPRLTAAFDSPVPLPPLRLPAIALAPLSAQPSAAAGGRPWQTTKFGTLDRRQRLASLSPALPTAPVLRSTEDAPARAPHDRIAD